MSIELVSSLSASCEENNASMKEAIRCMRREPSCYGFALLRGSDHQKEKTRDGRMEVNGTWPEESKVRVFSGSDLSACMLPSDSGAISLAFCDFKWCNLIAIRNHCDCNFDFSIQALTCYVI